MEKGNLGTAKPSLKESWQRYKDKPEYETSVFPFPPRRMSLFAKLHRDFLILVVLGGFGYILFKVAAYLM